MSIGTINQTAVYPREVVNATLKHHARSVILVHNHPSGEAKPSLADIAVTRDIEKALTVMGMTLHDHLIIADTICVSFKASAIITPGRLTKNSLFSYFQRVFGSFHQPCDLPLTSRACRIQGFSCRLTRFFLYSGVARGCHQRRHQNTSKQHIVCSRPN